MKHATTFLGRATGIATWVAAAVALLAGIAVGIPLGLAIAAGHVAWSRLRPVARLAAGRQRHALTEAEEEYLGWLAANLWSPQEYATFLSVMPSPEEAS